MAYARYKKLEKYIDGEPTGIFVEGSPTGETFSTKTECITGITDTSKWYWKKGTVLDAKTLTYFTIDGENEQYIYGHNSSPLPFNSTGVNTAYTGVYTDGLVHAGDLMSGVSTDYALNYVLSGTELRPAVDLLSADVSSWPSNCVSFSNMFRWCSNLVDIKGLTQLDGSRVSKASATFSGCESLETPIDMTTWSVYMTMGIGEFSPFYNCRMIPSITFNPDYRNEFIGQANLVLGHGGADQLFYNCASLKSLNLDNLLDYEYTSLTRYVYLREMFKGCTSLESVSLRDWKWGRDCYSANMFDGCISLKTLHMESDYGEMMGYYMTRGGNTQFTGCTNLTDIYIKDGSNGSNERYIKQMITGSGLSVDNINIHVTLVDTWLSP